MKKSIRETFSSPIVMILMILLVVTVLTYLIPAGEFDRTVDPVSGITVVDGASFHLVEKRYIGVMDFFSGIHLGFMNAADVIFMCFFSSFYIRVITESGAFSAGISTLLRRFGKNKRLLIPFFILIISLTGFTYGETEDLYPLIPLFVSAAVMAGFDPVVGVAISGGAVMVGFASSAFNPYTIGVAQKIAELPLYSGALFRTLVYAVFVAAYTLYVMRYARTHSGPDCLAGYDDIAAEDIRTTDAPFTLRHKIVLLGFLVIVGLMIYGALRLEWYFTEISALFIIGGVFSCIFLRASPKESVRMAIDGFRDIIMGVIVIGLARSILVLLSGAQVIDTVVYGLYHAVSALPKFLAPVGMLLVQTILNFFIPSGSGQASAVMPIMTPLSDLLGMNRQVAVLAFQMGDGFSNMLWPTAACAVICGIARVPLQKWYRFLLPFYGAAFLLQCVFILIANAIPLGPF